MQNWEEKISNIAEKVHALVDVNNQWKDAYYQVIDANEALQAANQQLVVGTEALQAQIEALQEQMKAQQAAFEAQYTQALAMQAVTVVAAEETTAKAPVSVFQEELGIEPMSAPEKAKISTMSTAVEEKDFAQEKEFIKKQIAQYIRDIDSLIAWVQSLQR